MLPRGQDPRQLGKYLALAYVGLEMVAPIGLGWWADQAWGWFPWCTVIGTVFGLVIGFTRLILVVNQPDSDESTKDGPPEERPR